MEGQLAGGFVGLARRCASAARQGWRRRAREEILRTAGKHAILKEDTPVLDVAEDRLRVSLECRYQRKGDSIDSASFYMHKDESR